jgi:hypothetical protein
VDEAYLRGWLMNRHCSNPDDTICRMGCAGNAACRYAVLSYIAPMQCGGKERAELARWKSSSSPAARGQAPILPAEVVDRETLAQWLVTTCKAFGAKLSTSYQVAGKFIEQMEKDEGDKP